MPLNAKVQITRQSGLGVLRMKKETLGALRQLVHLPHQTLSISKLKSEASKDSLHFVSTLEAVGVKTITLPREKNAEHIEFGIRFANQDELERPPRLDLSNVDSYKLSLLLLSTRSLAEKLGWDRTAYLNTDALTKDMQTSMLEYPGLSNLRMELSGGEIDILPVEGMQSKALGKALYGILRGSVLTEHTLAGEATRLGLGTKALLTPENLITAALEDKSIQSAESFKGLAPIDLGARHMAQFALDIMRLAKPSGFEPSEALNNQWMLIALNEKTSDQIIRTFVRNNHFLFNPEKVIFVVQKSFPGMEITNGEISFNPGSEALLHNHGALAMQTVMEGELFTAKKGDAQGGIDRVPISRNDYIEILKQRKNKISFPVEDLPFLTGGIDLQALAFAYEAARQGKAMTMEVVGQKEPPQTGGFLAFDRSLGRPVMIESDQGSWRVDEKDPDSLRRISALNRNFNMFPNPIQAFMALIEKGLPLHLTLKGGALYPQPPQGDQNFLVPTLFFRREEIRPILNLKSRGDIPKTLAAFVEQDGQGFLEIAKRIGLIK